jgi:nitrogen-specific signal transduction histidine kinase/CheY-like chemotaxis protein
MPKEGQAITVEGNLSCTFKDGQPLVVRGIYRDITERKRMEEHLRRAERMQAAGKLAGGVAHEVNNMMTGVIGFSEFLLRSLEPDDPRREDVEEVIKAGTRAADVTRQLLAFTRQQFLRPQVVEINAIVSDMEKMLRRSLGEDHQLELRLSPEAGQLRADRGQLEQVLINLVLNARDAMTGHGRVTIETAPSTWDAAYAERHGGVDIPLGRYVMLAVTDTGCGMDAETQSRIFEPFFTTKMVGQGTGLGLSTVYGIVKQSGGFVWVYSEPGQGSVFKVYLPEASAPRVLDHGMEAAPQPPAWGSETVLVVEDEEIVRNLALRGLREHGYMVVEARNGAEALAYVREHPGAVDLVISDVVMPEMGGRELGQSLTLFDPDLPVLYISGYTGEDVVQRGLLDPGAPFQQKPFTPNALASKVRTMLDQRSHRREATSSR